MSKNRLADLNDHFFLALEEIDAAKTPEEMDKAVRRAAAVRDVGREVLALGRLTLDACAAMRELTPGTSAPALLGFDSLTGNGNGSAPRSAGK